METNMFYEMILELIHFSDFKTMIDQSRLSLGH